MSFLFREHKGGLAESLATTREFKTVRAFLLFIQKEFNIKAETIKCKYQTYDYRVNWNTYLIYSEGYGVIGMTNKDIYNEEENEN